MADFCPKRISTVTGQVSLMPQTAVASRGAFLTKQKKIKKRKKKKKIWSKSTKGQKLQKVKE